MSQLSICRREEKRCQKERKKESYKQETVKNPSRQETAGNKRKKGTTTNTRERFCFFFSFSHQTLFSSSSLKVSQEKRREKSGQEKG